MTRHSDGAFGGIESRLQLAFEAGRLGTFDYNLVNQTVVWSARTKELFGLPPEAPIEFDTIWKAIPSDECAHVREVVGRAMRSADGRYHVEHRAIGLTDGVERWIAAWGRVLFDESGKPVGFQGINQDVTEIKRIELALRRARERQEYITDIVSRLLTADRPEDTLRELQQQILQVSGADSIFHLVRSREGELHLAFREGISQTALEPLLTRNFEPVAEPIEIYSPDAGQTLLAYALVAGGEVCGVLGFGSNKQIPFAPQDLSLVQALVGHVTAALDRMHDRAALRTSEERYSAIARNLPLGGVWVVDHDLRLIEAQGTLSQGFHDAGLLIRGEKIDATSGGALLQQMQEGFELALRGHENSRECDHEDAALWIHFVPVRDRFGEIGSALALALNFAERRRMEIALRESEIRERARAAELQAIMDAVPAATWVASDRECSEITANRFGYELLRSSPGSNVSLTGSRAQPLPFRAYLDGKETPPENLPMQMAARTGTAVRNCEVELRFDDGTSRVIFGNAVPVVAPGGVPNGAVGAFIDITEHKRLDDQLRQTQKLESIGLLAAGVAHEFNNLLTGILGNATLAQLTASATVRDKLVRIEQATLRAAQLTRQLLAYAGKGQFVVEEIDLARTVQASADLIRISVSAEIAVAYELPEARVPLLRADPAQVQQMLMNLIVNAAEAIGPNPDGRIQIRVDNDADRVMLQVSDNGCGMTDEQMARAFEPFYSTKFMGRGLGLAALQGIVRSLGGSVRVKSAPGVGTTFTVLLPCA